MGYYNYLSLDVQPQNDTRLSSDEMDVIIFDFCNDCKVDGIDAALMQGDSIKIRSGDDLLIGLAEFSKLHPNYLFVLECIGDEIDDRWRVYAINGKSHKVYATMPSYEDVKRLLS